MEAVCEYESHRDTVSLLLTDQILPGEAGRELAATLWLYNPKLKVLFVTGYAEQIELLEQEQLEYLAKPFSSGVPLKKVAALTNPQGTQDLDFLLCASAV
jgi:DNA-binding LytR/AlgR family response regulator